MEEAKPTPGPWSIKYGTNIVSATGRPIALCAVLTTNGPDEEQIHAESAANARLIAAAPDLLLACELIKGWIETNNVSVGPVVWAELRRAIARATGAR